MAKLAAESGILTITSFISPYRADRDAVRARMAPGERKICGIVECSDDGRVGTHESLRMLLPEVRMPLWLLCEIRVPTSRSDAVMLPSYR